MWPWSDTNVIAKAMEVSSETPAEGFKSGRAASAVLHRGARCMVYIGGSSIYPVQTTSPKLLPRSRSRALANRRIITSFWSESWNFLVRWWLSAPRETYSFPETIARAPETAPSIPRNRRPYNRSPSPRHNASATCWYNRRFGNRAQNCSKPCTYNQKGKLGQQTSGAAHTCTTTTGRLFIADKSTKHRFLIDTGSDVHVYPSKLIPQRRTGVNYDLCAANGTTIPTYGWLPLSLNLGFYMAIGGGWRHTTIHWSRLPLQLRSLCGL
jgi:hypothetical protein